MKVTDEMVEISCDTYNSLAEYACRPKLMRTALEDVLGDLPEVRVPDGWKCVPIQPSREMLEDAAKAHQRARINAACIPGDSMKAAYKAMLSATPTPPRGE